MKKNRMKICGRKDQHAAHAGDNAIDHERLQSSRGNGSFGQSLQPAEEFIERAHEEHVGDDKHRLEHEQHDQRRRSLGPAPCG